MLEVTFICVNVTVLLKIYPQIELIDKYISFFKGK